MKRLPVQVARDHLRDVANTTPVSAIMELIWNALDGESKSVEVEFREGMIEGTIDTIQVIDDGHGIDIEIAQAAFSSLGGSWKKENKWSKNHKRRLHGEKGQGRYAALSLGSKVEWRTTYKVDDTEELFDLVIICRYEELDDFFVSEPEPSTTKETGTTVTITNVYPELRDPRTEHTTNNIVAQLAPYMKQYPDANVVYDGTTIDPALLEARSKTFDLKDIEDDAGGKHQAKLEVTEWTQKVDRALYLCDWDGFAFKRDYAGIQAPGFDFTAYLKTNYVRELVEKNSLDLGNMDTKLTDTVDQARDAMRGYFKRREQEQRQNIIRRWKQERIYPYTRDASSPAQEAQRLLFNKLALDVHDHLKGFSKESLETKRFTFLLLKQALESNPAELQKVITEVLELPESELKDLAGLLDSTSLSSIISASKLVADRLNFLQGLENLLFDPQHKKALLERSQLHKILEPHTWLFGEEFNLTVSDQSLDNVLARHRHLLKRPTEEDVEPVKIPGGYSQAIVDLMLSRKVRRNHADELEHLVVELKRPKQSINAVIQSQLQRYAHAVASDDRFQDSNVRWSFWAISDRITDDVKDFASDDGLLFAPKPNGPKVWVWVKEWREVLDDCRARLEFFSEALDYSADNEAAMEHLRETQKDLLPDTVEGIGDEESEPATVN